MASEKQNAISPIAEVSRQEEERLVAVWTLLKDFEKSDYPAIRAGCGRARDEIWQVIFDLGLVVEEED